MSGANGSNTVRNHLTGGLVALGVLMSGSAVAASCPDGWEIGSMGGVSYIHPADSTYWFKLSGTLRFDQTFFMGSAKDKQNNFPSGGNVRTAALFMDGGVGEHIEYTMGLGFDGNDVSFENTFVSYSGLMENNQVYAGRISGNWFGLDNSNSSSWNPFLEKSLAATAFYPGDGLGVGADFWCDLGGFTLMAFQPDQRSSEATTPGVKDHWRGTARLTVAPVHNEGDVWHFGVSLAYRDVVSSINGTTPTNVNSNTGVGFRTRPSARARGASTSYLVNTTTGNGGVNIRANNVRMFNLEFAKQQGPFMLEAEYTNAFVHRIQDASSRGTLRFDGWNTQVRYLLTGESHAYDVRNGQFGSVTPNSKNGAVEIAARYDYINLNNKDVRGGSEHDVTVGLNWFVNQQVRLSANYIRADIRPANDAAKRTLDIIGMRAQVRFK